MCQVALPLPLLRIHGSLDLSRGLVLWHKSRRLLAAQTMLVCRVALPLLLRTGEGVLSAQMLG